MRKLVLIFGSFFVLAGIGLAVLPAGPPLDQATWIPVTATIDHATPLPRGVGVDISYDAGGERRHAYLVEYRPAVVASGKIDVEYASNSPGVVNIQGTRRPTNARLSRWIAVVATMAVGGTFIAVALMQKPKETEDA